MQTFDVLHAVMGLSADIQERLADDSISHEQVISWFHRPCEPRPPEYQYGPLEGQKQDLAMWLLYGERDPVILRMRVGTDACGSLEEVVPTSKRGARPGNAIRQASNFAKERDHRTPEASLKPAAKAVQAPSRSRRAA